MGIVVCVLDRGKASIVINVNKNLFSNQFSIIKSICLTGIFKFQKMYLNVFF